MGPKSSIDCKRCRLVWLVQQCWVVRISSIHQPLTHLLHFISLTFVEWLTVGYCKGLCIGVGSGGGQGGHAPPPSFQAALQRSPLFHHHRWAIASSLLGPCGYNARLVPRLLAQVEVWGRDYANIDLRTRPDHVRHSLVPRLIFVRGPSLVHVYYGSTIDVGFSAPASSKKD